MAQVISLQGKYPLALSVTTLPRSQGQCLVRNPKLGRSILLLDSHYPRHRRDGQKRTYLDMFRQQRAS